MNIKYSAIIILIPAYVLLGYMLPEECAAQNVKAMDNAGRDYFTVNSDIQTYQIIFKEHGKEYLTYYEALRKKIIQELKANYTRYYTEGDVNLLFILNADGSLVNLDVERENSTNDERLVEIATSSIRQASPFEPFPKGLDLPNMPFNLTISFKKR